MGDSPSGMTLGRGWNHSQALQPQAKPYGDSTKVNSRVASFSGFRLFPRQAHRLEQGFRGWVRQQSPYTENVNVAVGPCPEPLLCKRRTPYCRSKLSGIESGTNQRHPPVEFQCLMHLPGCNRDRSSFVLLRWHDVVAIYEVANLVRQCSHCPFGSQQ